MKERKRNGLIIVFAWKLGRNKEKVIAFRLGKNESCEFGMKKEWEGSVRLNEEIEESRQPDSQPASRSVQQEDQRLYVWN